MSQDVFSTGRQRAFPSRARGAWDRTPCASSGEQIRCPCRGGFVPATHPPRGRTAPRALAPETHSPHWSRRAACGWSASLHGRAGTGHSARSPSTLSASRLEYVAQEVPPVRVLERLTAPSMALRKWAAFPAFPGVPGEQLEEGVQAPPLQAEGARELPDDGGPASRPGRQHSGTAGPQREGTRPGRSAGSSASPRSSAAGPVTTRPIGSKRDP